jgi:hypothetical protein
MVVITNEGLIKSQLRNTTDFRKSIPF